MLLLVVIACLNLICSGQPGKNNNNPPLAGNLKYTFGSNEEIPSAFFENPPTHRLAPERKTYPACQDGSGGMCVEEGQCPPDLRPQANSTIACGPGEECCFGPPANDRSCRSRGGECTSPAACGRAPIFREANDCDSKRGEVCCIFV